MILLHSRIPSGYATDGDAFFEGLKRMGFSGFSLKWMHLSQAFVDDAHRHGMKVHTWTLNDPEDISGAALMGIDGVITDDPAATAALIARIRD
ncbi:MAG: glycerophosphodiester phosphodiesterase [Phycisphaerales bacterium]